MRDTVGRNSDIKFGKRTERFNKAVTTWKFTTEQVRDVLEGKTTFDDLKAAVKPVELNKSYSKVIDERTYYLMKHEGMSDSEVARYYEMPLRKLCNYKAKWGLKDWWYKDNRTSIKSGEEA